MNRLMNIEQIKEMIEERLETRNLLIMNNLDYMNKPKVSGNK